MFWSSCAFALLGLLVSQDPEPAQAAANGEAPSPTVQHPGLGEKTLSWDRSFALAMPKGWRQLTPDEARALSKRPEQDFPEDLVSTRPPAFYPYGGADRWLDQGFDGRCLTVARMGGEPSIDEAGLEMVREAQEDDDGGPWHRTIEDMRTITVGPSDHPLIECITKMVPRTGQGPTFRSLVLLVPTGGDTLILGFRAFEDDFPTALPLYRAATETLTFAREPNGPRELSDHLTMPLVGGAVVGIILLLLRRRAIS